MNPGNNPNNSWASGSTRPNAVPRSTSVEYEMESQAAMKRLQAPQNRPRNTVNRKPVSKTSSLRHVPDSEEEERPAQNGRGKSPFLDLVDSARKVIAPAAFYLQRTTGTGDVSTETPANPKDSSYDYVAEEQEYQMSQNSRRTSNATHKRNRMSTDNKAYRPEQSESSDEDFEEDGKTKRRKKKKKKEALGGPLSSLPVINADKRKKRRSKANKGASGTIDEDDDSESEDQVTDRVILFSLNGRTITYLVCFKSSNLHIVDQYHLPPFGSGRYRGHLYRQNLMTTIPTRRWTPSRVSTLYLKSKKMNLTTYITIIPNNDPPPAPHHA